MNINTSANLKNKPFTPYKSKLTKRDKIELWISRIIIWIAIIILLFPVLWIVGASLGKGQTFFQGSLFPKEISFENYVNLFKVTGEMNFGKSILNSLYLCTGVSIIQLFMTGTAAYAFARMRFTGRKSGLMTLLIIQMFPAGMTLPAIYTLLYQLNMLDKIWGLMLILAGGSAFNIWLLKGYIDGLPIELDEAAKVDGASFWQIFTKIILPLAAPMFAVIFLFTFITVYSEFMISSAALQNPNNYTIAVAMQRFIQNKFNMNWTMFAAAAVVSSVPIMTVFMLLQKHIQGGLVAGSVKG